MGRIRKVVEGIKTGLVLASTSEFGSALIKEAIESNSEDMKKAVITEVKNRLKEIETQRAFVVECQDREKFLIRQVEAIQAGQFNVDRMGHISFKDNSLETYAGTGRAIKVPKCRNCGYSVNLMVSV